MSKQIIDIGIAESSRVEIADGLSRLLADTYTLYIKTLLSLECNWPHV
jgi:starvation-inducible DNA-binding protein